MAAPLSAPSGGASQSLEALAQSAWASKIKDASSSLLSERKPWTELLDKNSFAKPESLTEASSRVRKNLAYFKVNYGIGVVSIVTLCLVTSPVSLAVVFALGAMWTYLFVVAAGQPLVVGGRQLSDREKLMGATGVTVLVVFFLSSVGSLLLYALGLGVRTFEPILTYHNNKLDTHRRSVLHTSKKHKKKHTKKNRLLRWVCTALFASLTTCSRMTHLVLPHE